MDKDTMLKQLQDMADRVYADDSPLVTEARWILVLLRPVGMNQTVWGMWANDIQPQAWGPMLNVVAVQAVALRRMNTMFFKQTPEDRSRMQQFVEFVDAWLILRMKDQPGGESPLVGAVSGNREDIIDMMERFVTNGLRQMYHGQE